VAIVPFFFGYGVDFNIPMGVGKVAIGDTVTVELDIQLVAP
jgi:hypothetical protein